MPREFVFMDRAAIGLGGAFLRLGARAEFPSPVRRGDRRLQCRRARRATGRGVGRVWARVDGASFTTQVRPRVAATDVGASRRGAKSRKSLIARAECGADETLMHRTIETIAQTFRWCITGQNRIERSARLRARVRRAEWEGKARDDAYRRSPQGGRLGLDRVACRQRHPPRRPRDRQDAFEAVIDALGYSPNVLARSLKTASTRSRRHRRFRRSPIPISATSSARSTAECARLGMMVFLVRHPGRSGARTRSRQRAASAAGRRHHPRPERRSRTPRRSPICATPACLACWSIARSTPNSIRSASTIARRCASWSITSPRIGHRRIGYVGGQSRLRDHA